MLPPPEAVVSPNPPSNRDAISRAFSRGSAEDAGSEQAADSDEYDAAHFLASAFDDSAESFAEF